MPRPLSLSLTGACSSPCLLRVPMRCVLELCTLVLGVWCTCAAFAQIVRHPLVNVVDIAGVHRLVLCAGAVHAGVVVLVSPMLALRVPAVHALAVHACGMRACASHARVACTCCACPCCACPRCARLCGACRVLVQRSPTPCGARRHRRQHTPDQPLVGPSDDRPDTYSPCLCSFLDPLQRTDPLDFDKQCCPRGRFDHLIGMAQMIWLLLLNSPLPGFHSGTGNPVSHSASTPPTPVHHTPVRLPHLLPHSTICAHSRCLRSFALHYTSSLPVRILAACAHTPPQINRAKKCHGGFTCLESFT